MQIHHKRNPVGHICKACRGWCCYRFAIDMPATKDNKPDWVKVRKIYPEEDVAFAEKHFVKMRSTESKTYTNARTFWFTCKKFDIETGLCSAHKTRPYVCRSYVCDQAHDEKRVPNTEDFKMQARSMRRKGISTKLGKESQ